MTNKFKPDKYQKKSNQVTSTKSISHRWSRQWKNTNNNHENK